MTAQTDLRTEARNLRRFGRNFQRERAVNAPWPVAGLVTEGVLCETFERGEALSSAIRRGCEHNTTLCAYGVDTYLKMILRDNFLHSDLHPGNILFHYHQPPIPLSVRSVNGGSSSASTVGGKVRLVLLDFGIADELPSDVRNRFLEFLFCLVHKDGVAAADTILVGLDATLKSFETVSWKAPSGFNTRACEVKTRCQAFGFKMSGVDSCLSNPGWSVDQKCIGADAERLRRDMCELCEKLCAVRERAVDIDAVLKAVMVLLRKHGVSIDAVYASLVVSMCVLVGFANSLDENLNLFEVAISAFLSYSVTGEVVGKLFAK